MSAAARPSSIATASLLACVWGLGVGCGRALPRPPIGPHPGPAGEYVEVPYPPPPARVEIVPPQPQSSASTIVWVDGGWTWQTGRWVWEPGGWTALPAQAFLAPWTIVRKPDGRLYFLPNAWHEAPAGKELPAPAVLVPAAETLGDLELEDAGADAGLGQPGTFW